MLQDMSGEIIALSTQVPVYLHFVPKPFPGVTNVAYRVDGRQKRSEKCLSSYLLPPTPGPCWAVNKMLPAANLWTAVTPY